MKKYPDQGTYRLTVTLKNRPSNETCQVLDRKLRQIRGCLDVRFEGKTLVVEYARNDIQAVRRRVGGLLEQHAPNCL